MRLLATPERIKRELGGQDSLELGLLRAMWRVAGDALNDGAAIDLEGLPLRTTLSLALEQIGLTYRVKDGLLWITSINEAEMEQDLFVGHCFIALLAAGLGGLVAPFVAAPGIVDRRGSGPP